MKLLRGIQKIESNVYERDRTRQVKQQMKKKVFKECFNLFGVQDKKNVYGEEEMTTIKK